MTAANRCCLCIQANQNSIIYFFDFFFCFGNTLFLSSYRDIYFFQGHNQSTLCLLSLHHNVCLVGWLVCLLGWWTWWIFLKNFILGYTTNWKGSIMKILSSCLNSIFINECLSSSIHSTTTTTIAFVAKFFFLHHFVYARTRPFTEEKKKIYSGTSVNEYLG